MRTDDTSYYNDTGVYNSPEEDYQTMDNLDDQSDADFGYFLTDETVTNLSPIHYYSQFHDPENKEDNLYESIPSVEETDTSEQTMYDDAESLRHTRYKVYQPQDSSPTRFPHYVNSSMTKRNVPVIHRSSDDLHSYYTTQDGYSTHQLQTTQNSQTFQSQEDSDPIYDDIEGLSRPYQNTVDELINTEEEYVQNLSILTSCIKPRLEEIPEVDVKSLFCNVDEILLVARSFLMELKRTESHEQNQLKYIGELFQHFSEDMESTYSMYCWEYQKSLSLLETYKETHVFQQIQEVLNSGMYAPRPPDITFYLVKPVQRIMKYPLLLDRILKNLPENEESHAALQKAHSMIEEVNLNINEFKRRKEIGSKYHRQEKKSLIDKMTHTNFDAVIKTVSRKSQTFKQFTGIVPKREDKEFDNLADKFEILVTAVKQLKQNVENYMKNLEVFLCIQPISHLTDLQESTAQLQDLSEFHQNIYPEFKRRLQVLVLEPLSSLSECSEGPKKLIRKRKDKLLDYEMMEGKTNETGTMSYEEELIKEAYKGINSMLLSELPIFISKSMDWLLQLLFTFVHLQQELAEYGLHAAQAEASRMPYSMIPEADFRKWIEDSICHSVSQLDDLAKKFEEEMPTVAIQEHTPAIKLHVQQLMKRHRGQKEIYQVTSNVSGSGSMALTLQRGDVVAVLQKTDTKGNKNKWLVDTVAGSKGYVHCGKLHPYQSVDTPMPSHDSLSPDNKVEKRRHSDTPIDSHYPIHAESQDTTPVFQTIAGYAFTARSNYEVSVTAGEPVTVIEPHDKKGSPDWSLVEVRGQMGYIPSSYLVRVPVQNVIGWVPLSNYT